MTRDDDHDHDTPLSDHGESFPFWPEVLGVP